MRADQVLLSCNYDSSQGGVIIAVITRAKRRAHVMSLCRGAAKGPRVSWQSPQKPGVWGHSPSKNYGLKCNFVNFFERNKEKTNSENCKQ